MNFKALFEKNGINFAIDCTKFVRIHSKKNCGYIEGKMVQQHINKEACTVFVALPLFYPTAVCKTINHLLFYIRNYYHYVIRMETASVV
jgi:hypothetical protein